MARRFLAPLVLTMAIACGGENENPVSEPAAPLETFPGLMPPEVSQGWPCPPFTEVESTEDRMGDDDGDGITDCQEDVIGSLADSLDSDADGVPDEFELGELLAEDTDDEILDNLFDSDGDDILDIIDPDDDNDLILTIDEDAAPAGNGDGDPTNDDYDGDGEPNYLDDDDDDDLARNDIEDLAGSGPDCLVDGTANDGDPTNDDFDCDGLLNWLDEDDDNDTAVGCEDTVPDGRITAEGALVDDVDGDGNLDPYDPDDDGDGIPTALEDSNGDGNPCNDDNDGDGRADFRDLDEDNDLLDTTVEDLNGNGLVTDDDSDGDGIADYRDDDDDNDGVDSADEGTETLLDTDNDGTPNYLDVDDDGDGCRTSDEDTDGDGDLENDDADADKIPDYLDADSTACAATRFDLQLTGSGFEASEGSRVYVRVSDDMGTPIDGANDVIAAGGFAFTFPLAVQTGGTYVIDYYVDVVVDGVCDAGSDTIYQLTGLTGGASPLEIMTTADSGLIGTCAL